jgi:membrane-associated phospholipid phosphatase
MRPPHSLFAALLLALAAFGTSSTARGADPPTDPPPVLPATNELRWNDEWPRFRPVEIVLTAEASPAAIAEYWLALPQPHPHWTQHNAFDDAIRNALRLRSTAALRTSWTAASVVDVVLVASTVGVDSVIVPFLRRSTDVAMQLGFIDCESFAISSIVAISAYDIVGRARPSYDDCQRNPSFSPDCHVSPTASFPSGHVNQAFTAAGLSCAQHTMLPLYGSRAADILACARDLALASADGVLRIMGDRHYATDVLTGGALGFAWGYGLPMLLHFGRHDGSPSPAWSLSPLAGSAGTGLALIGTL